ncbi:MAG: glycerol kinase, partial [Candidatus Melainabacteria bacterium]|nr:glycerol kinase [Candidatus Melainabacteria bacterium]
AHFVRAALESMAYQVADVAKDIAEHGIRIEELRVDGGATRNKFMLQFQADLLQVPVLRSSQQESTAWGVAALAGIKAGLVSGLNAVSSGWRHDLTLTPHTNRTLEYKGWQTALDSTFAFGNHITKTSR